MYAQQATAAGVPSLTKVPPLDEISELRGKLIMGLVKKHLFLNEAQLKRFDGAVRSLCAPAAAPSVSLDRSFDCKM